MKYNTILSKLKKADEELYEVKQLPLTNFEDYLHRVKLSNKYQKYTKAYIDKCIRENIPFDYAMATLKNYMEGKT